MLTGALPVVVGESAAANFVDITVHPWQWVLFLAVIVALLLVDLFVFNRDAHVVTARQAAVQTAFWVSIGLSMTLVFWFWHGGPAAGEYLAGYLVEYSLSIDNVFVWALILTYFAVPREYQHRVLFWGIFGALVFRAVFIFAGVALLERFDWIIYVFGAILLYTAVRLLTQADDEVHPENNPVLRLVRRVIPSTAEYDGHRLFVRHRRKILATPLFAVLVVIETSDVIFAVDSIPAILAVTREQFIVFTSNAFAILGLRSLYFLLADLKDRFEYLQEGLALILIFVGAKMLLSQVIHISTALSLLVIVAILVGAIVWSVVMVRRQEQLGADGDAPIDEPTS